MIEQCHDRFIMRLPNVGPVLAAAITKGKIEITSTVLFSLTPSQTEKLGLALIGLATLARRQQ